MAVPKTTGTRLYLYGSAQARQIIEGLHMYNPIPTSFFQTGHPSKLYYGNSIVHFLEKGKKYNLVPVVFGTAIPTSLYIFST